MAAIGLVERPAGATLFLLPGGSVGAGTFLAEARSLAARLPPAPHVINLCRDRYRFTVTFAAALIGGRVCLLPGEASPMALSAVVALHDGCVAVADETVAAPCPVVVCTADGTSPGQPDRAGGHDVAIDSGHLAAIAFTSGSTGAPAAHPKRWGELVARSRAAGARFDFAEDAPVSVVGTIPPGHMYGFETTVLLPLHAACASWCGASFFPADVEAATARPGRHVLVTTPLQLRALQTAGLASLAGVISATAPLEAALAGSAEARWGAPVREIFGATECGSIATRRTTADEPWQLYDGLCLDERDGVARVHGLEMAPVPLADEIEVLGESRFRLLGRRTDVVKLGGRRASLAGLNRILAGLEGVEDGVFVVPEDLERRSTARLLAVVVAPGHTAASILEGLRGQMDPVFLPRRVIQVAALPRNTLGKLPRQAVLALIESAG